MHASGSIQINTKYGTVRNVPVIKWIEFQPYWEPVVRAIVEVIVENKFRPYSATIKRPDGFVASSKYWETYGYRHKKLTLDQPKKFIELLMTKEGFRTAITEFNSKSGVDWLNPKNLHLLGGRVYGFYYTLRPIFSELRDKDGLWLTVNFA